MKLTVSEVELISMMSNRVKARKITTHKEWFECNCASLNLDFNKMMTKLLNNKLITRSSKGNLWPVSIMISR